MSEMAEVVGEVWLGVFGKAFRRGWGWGGAGNEGGLFRGRDDGGIRPGARVVDSGAGCFVVVGGGGGGGGRFW